MPHITDHLYKLPFTKNNNPNGWIEPTTYCQLRCPHCYRVCEESYKPEHKNIEGMFAEVDYMAKFRNVQTISIAGGEPLLYPELNTLIKYIKNKGLNVLICTNGILLDQDRLFELEKCGVDRILIHITKYQNIEGAETEEEVNKIRERYCQLFRNVKNVTLGFNFDVSGENIEDLNVLIPFYKKNADIIHLAVFTRLGEVLPDKILPKKEEISAERIAHDVQRLYDLEYCAYLGKTVSHNYAQLFSFNLYSGKKYLGSVDRKVPEYFQSESLRKTGKYSLISNSNTYSFKFMLFILSNKSLRKIMTKYFASKNRGPLREHVVMIFNTPQKIDDKWDFCDGCIDSILYDGKLVPSCLLERVKRGEKIEMK